MTAVAVDLCQHGERCCCTVCALVRSLLVLGGQDRWAAAVEIAHEHGLIDDADVERAFVTGADVLELVGF